MANYTSLSSEEIESILSEFGISYNSHSLINGGMANTSFLVNEKFVLTALDNHDKTSAHRLTRTISYLRSFNINTPPLIRCNGHTDIVFYNDTAFVLKPWIAIDPNDHDPFLLAEGIGETLAAIHSLPTPSFLTRLGRRIPKDALTTIKRDGCSELAVALQRSQCRSIRDTLERCSLAFCHGDLMTENVLVASQGDLVVIDWETATIDSPLLDIGIAAISAIKLDLDLREYINRLLFGYQRLSTIISTEDFQGAVLAFAYACTLISYHRYVRHNIKFPDSSKCQIYRELLFPAMSIFDAKGVL